MNKKCPNCGACQECGHAPNRGMWVQPFWPQTYPPYYVGDWPLIPTTTGNPAPTTWTITTNTAGSYSA